MQKRFSGFMALGAALLAMWASGCATTKAAKSAPALASSGCAIALLAHQGETDFDRELRQRQSKIRQMHEQGLDVTPNVESLGWRFVEKARRSYDPGFYKVAEQCAACVESLTAELPAEKGKLKNAAALLLRGHILQNLHRFGEAQAIAVELAEKRGLAFDFMLLGDVLLEQGKLREATVAYQKLLDLKPGLQSYARAAQLRWLSGDTEGAIEMALQAAQAVSPKEAEASAWATTRLAFYQLHYGALPQAAAACEAALQLFPDYAPALLIKGRVLLAQQPASGTSAAIPFLQTAAKLNPLPEYQWTLADALRAEGREVEAQTVETTLQTKGATEDPRTYALYLATRQSDAAQALRLAEAELKNRQDAHSYDALAWTSYRAGQTDAAWQAMQKALATGLRDARLHWHAAAIAQAAGQRTQAVNFFKLARQRSQALLPSERAQLLKLDLQ
jgi:tetratricopeptide (TPR) repeat protein